MRMVHIAALAWGMIGACLIAACGGKVVVDDHGAGGTTTTGTTTGTTGIGGAGGGVVVDCDPGHVACNSPTPVCDMGQAPSVVNGCWGDCVPILSCATVSSCDGCLGFCAAYEGWGTEYRCAATALLCQSLQCGCLGQYFCVAPFDACTSSTSGPPFVACGCPTC